MKVKNILLGSLLLVLLGYLAWQLVYSNNGAISLFRLSSKREKLISENKCLDEQRVSLEKKVRRMKSKSLDLDTLDEQARKNLGYGKDKEFIYVE
jgi:cell division protein FtsB